MNKPLPQSDDKELQAEGNKATETDDSVKLEITDKMEGRLTRLYLRKKVTLPARDGVRIFRT